MTNLPCYWNSWEEFCQDCVLFMPTASLLYAKPLRSPSLWSFKSSLTLEKNLDSKLKYHWLFNLLSLPCSPTYSLHLPSWFHRLIVFVQEQVLSITSPKQIWNCCIIKVDFRLLPVLRVIIIPRAAFIDLQIVWTVRSKEKTFITWSANLSFTQKNLKRLFCWRLKLSFI